MKDVKSTLDEKFKELDDAINHVSEKCEEKQKVNPKYQYPSLELDELCEFNSLRHELALDNKKTPAITASRLAVKSSFRRLPMSKKNPSFSSGVSRARRLRGQAKHIVTFKELLTSNTGLKTHHDSMLDNKDMFKALYQWTVEQKPGKVHCTISNFPILING